MRSTPRPRDRFVIIAGSSKPVEALHTPVPLELPPSGSAPRGAWSPRTWSSGGATRCAPSCLSRRTRFDPSGPARPCL